MMGTTADKLQAILDSKNAIKNKFNLPDDLPFSQYAENIINSSGGSGSDVTLGVVNEDGAFQALSFNGTEAVNSGSPETVENYHSWNSTLPAPEGSGGGGEYYLCSYVNRTYASNDFTVSGVSETLFANGTDWDGKPLAAEYQAINPNGTYTPYKQSEDSVMYWRWKNEHGCFLYYTDMMMGWQFTPFDNEVTVDIGMSNNPLFASASWENTPYPWDSSLSWVDHNSSAVSCTIAQVIPEAVEQYWDGYKLEKDGETNKWSISDTSSKLTYTNYMPVAGRIYDKECTIELADIDLEEQYRYSTPINLTSDDSDEWLVSAISVEGTNYAYYAFDGDSSTRWRPLGSTEMYLQWQSKTRKHLVKKLAIYGSWDNMPRFNTWDKSVFQASDNGTNWVTLTYTLTEDYNNSCRTLTLDDNYTMYNYYRLYRPSNSGDSSQWTINSVIGTYLEERVVPE